MIENLNIKRISTQKAFDLGLEKSQTSHDPDKVIFNYFSHVLTVSETVIFKALKFLKILTVVRKTKFSKLGLSILPFLHFIVTMKMVHL